ncbi:hypothetical protein JKP88DRAFT_248806 [Tribonema minus]|uniref:Uncharacterized protein n=1 Tax=Tribonema minus TaxID=303371 RepID=A0A836CAV9_9STRA|nr:hypothetical protein JKP88DRAFT_248806 [Tribonema minus]
MLNVLARQWRGAVLSVVVLLLGCGVCEGAVELSPSVGTNAGSGSSVFCADAIETGQAAGTCNLVSEGYPLGAGADLLMAARFQSFAAAGGAASTDHNVGGVLADYELTVARSNARLDAQRSLRGTAQVDLFLCSDGDCNVIADVVHVVTEGKPNGTLAMGYARFAHSLVALPAYHIRADSVTPRVFPVAESRRGVARSKVAWALADASAEWVSANMVMMPFGALVRFLALSARSAELDLGVLRAGAYTEQQTGDCVIVISFKHPWMDAMGWGTSNCDPGDPAAAKVYVFDSYFAQASELPFYSMLSAVLVTADQCSFKGVIYTSIAATNLGMHCARRCCTRCQANLQWPPAKGVVGGGVGYVFPLADEVGGGNWRDGAAVRSYGAAMVCGSEMYINQQTVGATRYSCVNAEGGWAASQPPSDEDLAAMVQEEQPPTDDPRWLPQLLVLGAAAVSAWEISEPFLDVDGTTMGGQRRYVMMDPGDFPNSKGREENPVRGGGGGAQDSGVFTNSALATFIKYGVLTSASRGDSALPWCETDAAKINRKTFVPDDLRRGYVAAGGKLLALQDCEVLWPLLGWGNVHGAGADAIQRGGAPAATGVRGLLEAGLLRPSWTDLEESPNGNPYNTDTWGNSFVGGGVLLVSALPAGVAAVVTSAEAVLSSFCDAELSNMEMTLTPMGAALVLSQTLVALIASYAARRELVGFFARVLRMPLLAASLLTVAAFLIGIMTPAVLTAIAESAAHDSNPDGSDSQVRWVHAQANGLAQYNVVAAVTMTFQADTDDSASLLVWVNLALAAFGWVWCSWSVLRGSQKTSRAPTGQAPVKEDSEPRRAISSQLSKVDPCLMVIS